ncbi:potassium channel subfamily K member 17 [Brienomyrus brachyistius]|uniref:potassium channel subfamily K member 17 n=1 Tax=Brienomyrus brachyistius TaxID=42636 RepID=UPI0020B2DE40|nr:potassium channel subfamily K member 17 [Brienomyrus brachyistius]
MGSCFARSGQMRLPSILLLGFVYMVYVLIGGVVFWKLEGSQVEENIAQLLEERAKLLSSIPCLDQQAIDTLTEVVQRAISTGLSLKMNQTMDGFWKFTSSAVFAATVITTIGYGNICPRTMEGQIFCVFFALFGIPLNVVVLNRVGKYMLAIERNICDFMETKTKYKQAIRVMIHLLSLATGTAVFFVVPMIVFALNEGWSYAQAIYYCFISLSTIGFGDYVADSNPNRTYSSWYGCLVAAWIFFGMAWLALLINHAIDILERINACLKQHGSRTVESRSDSVEHCDSISKEVSSMHSELTEDQAPERGSRVTSPDNVDKSPSS